MPTKCFTEIDLLTFECPNDRGQAFLWDSEVNGLGVRTTPRGSKAFIFQGRIGKKTVRKTIGRVDELSIAEARTRALELRVRVDRESELTLLPGKGNASEVVESGQGGVQPLTIGQLWTHYSEQGQPKRRIGHWRSSSFSPGYIDDLKRMVLPGGERKKRGSGQLKPGPLSPLTSLAIEDLDEFTLREWYLDQCKRSHAQATRALVMLRGFLRWCVVKPEFHAAAVKAMKASKSLVMSAQQPARKSFTNVIQPSELPAWWAAVLDLPDKKVSVFLRALVMTGRHSQAMRNLRWKDVRLGWGDEAYFSCHLYRGRSGLLTEEFVRLIESLPRDSEFIFSGRGKSGRMPDPRDGLKKAFENAGLEPRPLGALRRTFIMLSEMAGLPSSAITEYSLVPPPGTRERKTWLRRPVLRAHICHMEATLKQILGVKSLV